MLTHAHALLTSTPQGATDYIDANMHEPDTILEAVQRTLHLDQPVGLTFMGVLGHVTDNAVRSIITTLMAGLAPGSHLAICDGYDTPSPEMLKAQQDYDDGGSVPYKLRGREELESFFTGLELLPPGLVPAPQWRPETESVGPRRKCSPSEESP